MCCVCRAVTIFLSLQEFPRDDDDAFSTIGFLIRSRPTETTPASTTPSGTDGQQEENDDEEEDEDDYGGRQVLGRLRVRRDAFDHLDTQHVDELWRSAEDLLERSAVTDAKRRLARRRRDLDYWHKLTTLLQQLDLVDRIAVRLRHLHIEMIECPVCHIRPISQ